MGTTYYSGTLTSLNCWDPRDYWATLMERYQNLAPNRSHFLPRGLLPLNLSALPFTRAPLPLMNGPFETNSREVILPSTVQMLRALV